MFLERSLAALIVLTGCSDRPAPAPVTSQRPTESSTDARTVESNETACDHILVAGDDDGLWIAAPPEVGCTAPRKAGVADIAWLSAELQTLKSGLDPACVPLVDLVGFRGDDITRVQEALDTVGLTANSIALAEGVPPILGKLARSLKPTSSSLTHCPTPARTGPKHPIITIDAAEITVTVRGRTQSVARVADVDKSSEGDTSTTVPGLAAALGTPTEDRHVVLKAEAATSVIVINRVVNTLKQAGLVRVVFAVSR